MATKLRVPNRADVVQCAALADTIAKTLYGMQLTAEEAAVIQNFSAKKILDTLLAALREEALTTKGAAVSQWSYGTNFVVRPIEEQIRTLAAQFGLNAEPALQFAQSLPPLTPGAEGWFAVVTAAAYAKKSIQKKTRVHQHAAVTAHRIAQLCAAHALVCDHTARQLGGPLVVTQTDRTAEAVEILTSQQKGDILIFPAQLGQRFFGQPAAGVDRRLSQNEFVLTLFMLTCIQLTHPTLHTGKCTIRTLAIGDIVGPTEKFKAVGNPSLHSHVPSGWLSLMVRPCAKAHFAFGAATGFLLLE